MRSQILVWAIFASMNFISLVQAAPHGMYLTQEARNLKRIPNTPRIADAPKKLLYFGGPVISHAKIYTVFWGSNVNPTTQKQIGGFLSAAINSTYMDWLGQYNTQIKAVDGREGTHQTIGRGTYLGEILINPSFTGKTLDDSEIQAELDHQIETGGLPKPDDNTLFMIYFPPGLNIKIDGAMSCSGFCAYHEGFVSKRFGNVFYGVMPDQSGYCSFSCGGGTHPFDGLTSVSSHEMMEAITDPFPTPGDKPAYPQAWNTSDGNEIADICNGPTTALTTQGLTYRLSKEFDNTSGSCAAGPYHSP